MSQHGPHQPPAAPRSAPWRLHRAAILAAALVGATSDCTRATTSRRVAAADAVPAPGREGVEQLAARIEQRIASVPGAAVGVAYLAPGSADSLFINADTAFHAASTMKVPVMVELMRRVDGGELRLDQPIALRNEFASIVDGSPYSLDPGDDSDSTLYSRVGTTVRLDELMERMITRSSNLATNVLMELVSADSVTVNAGRLGAGGASVLRGVEDDLAFRNGLSNTITARALATLMSAIETGRAGSPAATTHMRSILLRQEFSDAIPAGLPPGTPVAHKTGSITATLHDAAIVYPRDRSPYVLVVLTGRIAEPAVARALIADVTRLVDGFDAARRGGVQ